jgi:hypothetical protein
MPAMRDEVCHRTTAKIFGYLSISVDILTFCVSAAAFGSLHVSGNLDCLHAVLKRRQSGSYVYS